MHIATKTSAYRQKHKNIGNIVHIPVCIAQASAGDSTTLVDDLAMVVVSAGPGSSDEPMPSSVVDLMFQIARFITCLGI